MSNEGKALPVGVSSSGTDVFVPIEYVYDNEAKCFIPQEGKKLNRYKMIQASAGSCDITNIMKRAACGDVSALNVPGAFYGDVSEVPTNINDIHQLQIEAINGFNKLDPNVKAIFGNDVNIFIKAYNDGTYLQKITNAFKTDDVKIDDVKTETKEGD